LALAFGRPRMLHWLLRDLGWCLLVTG
jgi:hypothetical protein